MAKKASASSSSWGKFIAAALVVGGCIALVVVLTKRKQEASSLPPSTSPQNSSSNETSSPSTDSQPSVNSNSIQSVRTIGPTTTLVPITTTIAPTTTAAPVAGVLDGLSSSARSSMMCGFSIKRLFSSYIGATIKIRRSSDGATSEFYADAYGNLGQSLNGTGTSLTTWLGANNTGYVMAWYDQTNHGRDAVQSNSLIQPSINQSLKAVDFSNNTSSYFTLPDGSFPSSNSAYTMAFRQQTVSSTFPQTIHYQGAKGTKTLLLSSMADSTKISHAWWTWDYPNVACATTSTNVFMYDGSSYAYGYTDGVAKDPYAGSSRATKTEYATIGCFRDSGTPLYYFGGRLNFLFAFNSKLSDSDRTIIEQAGGY